MDLGGQIRKSYTMQATSSDTESSVSAELEAAYGGAMLGASAKASVGVSSRSSNKNAQMNVEWSAKGGDTTIWLGKEFDVGGDTSVSSIQEEWAKTITDDNLYPFDFDLGLVWDIIKGIDEEKGNEYQKYLEEKWEKNKNLFKPTKFLKGW